jgi:exodeoxyribonuclease V alpha subunit
LFLEQRKQTPAELRQVLQHWVNLAYVESGFQDRLAQFVLGDDLDDPLQFETLGELFRLVDRTRLLTLVREGPWGCDQINQCLAHHLRPRLGSRGEHGLFHGALVLVTRNDVGRGLFNGDVGLALRATDGGLRVAFARRGSYLCYSADALPPHELGFALTVHKSQGSEYGRVLLVFPPSGGRWLLTKELVYTGVTRAKELAILCATRDVLGAAIQRKCQRESGLLHLIQGA